MDKATLVAKLKAYAKKRGTNYAMKLEFMTATGVSQHFINKHFKSWAEYCIAAGLEPAWDNSRISDDELFSEMKAAFLRLKGITNHDKFAHTYRFSRSFLERRTGGWVRGLIAFRKWCVKNAPDFPYLDQLPKDVSDLPATGKERRAGWRAARGAARAFEETYGEFIDFRAMRHAPISEQGVVLLFGMVAEELGYSIEATNRTFPDCDAKQRIALGRWRRVAIEFEYKSANFKLHGHDPKACDLIVCWEHNWPDCPLNVVELKSEIRKLKGG